MSDRRFSIAAQDLNDSIHRVFVGALRKGLADGFEEAVHSTLQDSSNAAVHWMIGATDGSRASSRSLGRPSDLRATVKGGQQHSLVGRRGEHRSTLRSTLATQVADAVVDREVKVAIDKYARGHTPSTGFYYYNAIMDNPKYAGNARLEEAGELGVTRAVASFEREIAQGNERRYRTK